MIAIRAARAEDAGAIAAIYAPHVLAGVASFEEEAPDTGVMRRRMAKSDGLYPWLVAVETAGADDAGGVLGYAYAGSYRDRAAYRWCVETTIYISGAIQRQGVGRLLYEALIDTLRAQGFTQAIGAIALPNDGSIGLHEQVGFRRAGVLREVGFKHGRWIDVGLWQVDLNDTSGAVAAPKRFADVGVVRV